LPECSVSSDTGPKPAAVVPCHIGHSSSRGERPRFPLFGGPEQQNGLRSLDREIGGVRKAALPAGNRPEAEALEPEVRAAIEIVLAEHASELVDVVPAPQ